MAPTWEYTTTVSDYEFFLGGGEFELQEARTADTSESLLFC